MKLSFLILVLLIGQMTYAQTIHQQLQVVKVEPKKNQCVEIPGTFSHEKISESNLLKGLQSKKIRRVELIYTRYRENASFDQDKLNEDRMFRLNQLLPKLQNDQPEIVWIEQTGASTREEASKYFHGFRIYTENQNEKQHEHEIFNRISREDSGNPALKLTVDNAKGGTFSHASGSQIHIPAHAAVYENGKLVVGNYTITYREYRDPAEIAFSGIPMEFRDKTGTYLFNSAGMYEIRGTKDGKQLALQKDITVDFNCTKKEAGVNFYEMNDANGQWKLLKSDLFEQSANNQKVVTNDIEADTEPREARKETKISYIVSKPYSIVTLDEDTRTAYRSLAKKSPQKIQESVAQDLTADFQLKVRQEYVEALVKLIWDEYYVIQAKTNANEFGFDLENTLLGGEDKGHQYPNLVKGLNSSSFGVYNCDQVYRLANQVTVSPKYVNASTKKEIKDQNILCLIDKKVNASFSFDPAAITCDSKAANIFLLFTQDGETYVLQPGGKTPVNLSDKKPVFLMERITDKVKTSDDLKRYLSI